MPKQLKIQSRFFCDSLSRFAVVAFSLRIRSLGCRSRLCWGEKVCQGPSVPHSPMSYIHYESEPRERSPFSKLKVKSNSLWFRDYTFLYVCQYNNNKKHTHEKKSCDETKQTRVNFRLKKPSEPRIKSLRQIPSLPLSFHLHHSEKRTSSRNIIFNGRSQRFRNFATR